MLAGENDKGLRMNNLRKTWLLWGFALVGGSLNVVSSSCSTVEPPKGELVQFAGESPSGSSQLELVTPEGWIEEEPSSSMRQMQYRLPGSEASGGDAEVAIFSGIGGSVEQNVERWLGQFESETAPQVSKRTINGYLVTFVDVSGTFKTGMMSAKAEPRAGYRMLAAVIETSSSPWFVKLVGPKETVEKWAESFRNYVESIKGSS